MRDRLYVSSGECFQVDKHSFSIAETLSDYTLYTSVACKNGEDGEREWRDAAGGIPDGWKPCSSEIPAGTLHNVYDVVPGQVFYLYGCTDARVYLRW